MLELNDESLDKLKCNICEDYLSCAPVLLKNNGNSICGRCPAPQDEYESTRNTPYEELAQFVIFPCQYKKNGCHAKYYFAALKDHELACAFRQYICPVMASGSCDWLGTRTEIFEHCQKEHPDNVLKHPCVLEHDIRRNSLRTFITAAFNLIFLIHAKVCLTTKKIYHSVRLIGFYDDESILKYRLDIGSSKIVLTRDGIVAPEGCLAIQENTSVATGINSLLEFLGGFKNTTFKITIISIIDCVQCNTLSSRSCYRTAEGWFCINCAPDSRYCKNSSKGCTFTDIETKTMKHERIFCQYTNLCLLCKEHIQGNLKEHYSNTHSDVTYKMGTKLPADTKESSKQWLVTNYLDRFICMYTLNSSTLLLNVFSSLESKDLYLHDCVLELSNPSTGIVVQKSLSIHYNKISDWSTLISENEFQSVVYRNMFNIKIDVINIANKLTKIDISK